MTHEFVIIANRFDRVSAPPQLSYHSMAETRFEPEPVTRRAPGPSEQPARCVDGLLQRLSENDMTRENRRLRLRLSVTPHRAVDDLASIMQYRSGGTQRVKRLLARLERKQMIGLEAERRTAVLPIDAGRCEHDATAEFVITALNERHGHALTIDGSHPHRISRTAP